MTTTESRPDTSPADDASSNGAPSYNLARQAFGVQTVPNPHREVNGSNGSNGSNGNYNLARQVYGSAVVAAPVSPATPPSMAIAAPALDGGAPPRRGRFQIRTLDSVREVPAFRWYTIASIGSFGAMNMQMLARGYLVFDLTGSFAALGTVFLFNALPGLFLTMVGGVAADKYPKKYIVQIGQTMSALLALVIGLLLAFHMLRVEHLYASAFVNGTIFAMMMPSRQAWVIEVVGRRRLMNAVALNSAVMTTTRLIAPLFASILFAEFGPRFVYFTMVGLYVFSVLTLTRVRSLNAEEQAAAETGGAAGPMRGRGRPAAGGFRQLLVGFGYVWRDHTIRLILITNLITVSLAQPYFQLLPGWVTDVLGGDVRTLGTLQTIGAAGALVGALFVASLPNRQRGVIYLCGSLLMGVMLIGFSASSVFWVTALLMIVLNMGQTVRMSLSNVLVQSYVEDEYRGRVMSVYMMQMSIVSFGSFFIGLLAEFLGPQVAMGGVATVLVLFTSSMLLFSRSFRTLQ
ncbi:MAG: MFS transporter [Dehalococcoidia bacterium]